MLKLGIITTKTDPARAMWRALDPDQKLLALALGLFTLDDAGLPVLEPEMMARRLKEITQSLEGT